MATSVLGRGKQTRLDTYEQLNTGVVKGPSTVNFFLGSLATRTVLRSQFRHRVFQCPPQRHRDIQRLDQRRLAAGQSGRRHRRRCRHGSQDGGFDDAFATNRLPPNRFRFPATQTARP